MRLSQEIMVERFFARDPAFERRFVVGVLTTGIYCVPTCTARRPRPENVRFFESIEDARRAGLRACLRCRPDEVHAGRDPERDALESAVARLRAAPGDFLDVRAFAHAAGFGPTKLGELAREHYHATPRALLTAARVDYARRELLATRRRVLAIGLDAGFEGASAFHENFRAAMGLSPGDYRRMASSGAIALRLPAGYALEHTLAYLSRDPEQRTERVSGTRFARALRLDGKPAVLEIDLVNGLSGGLARGRVDARGPLAPEAVGAAHHALLRLLGLALDPEPFERRARGDEEIARLIRGRRGLRIPQTPDPFEGLMWTIIGQKINVAFAFVCRNRMIELAGARAGPAGSGLIAHPTPAEIAKLDYADLTRLQFSRRKAEYVIDTARAVAEQRLDLEQLAQASATRAEERLLAVRGIGVWSVRYLLMRSLGFADCVPVGDAGLVRALQELHGLEERPGPAQTLALMQRYAPHRSLATFHLWKTLGEPA